MATNVYSYARCSTCVKALRWLGENGHEVRVKPIVESPPSAATLKKAWKRSGLPIKRFFNTSGASYRDGGFSAKLPAMSETEALAALASDGKLIKRPLVIADDFVLVGFREDEYAAAFGVGS